MVMVEERLPNSEGPFLFPFPLDVAFLFPLRVKRKGCVFWERIHFRAHLQEKRSLSFKQKLKNETSHLGPHQCPDHLDPESSSLGDQ